MALTPERIDEIAGRIFPYRGASVSAAFQRAAKMCGIHDATLHDLRHEGISRLFEAGLNIPEVSLISGHSSWASLKRYTQIQPAHVLEKLVPKAT
jgi:integrase